MLVITELKFWREKVSGEEVVLEKSSDVKLTHHHRVSQMLPVAGGS